MQKLKTRPILFFLLAFIILSFLTEGIAIIHGTGTSRVKITGMLRETLDSLVKANNIPGATFALCPADGRTIAIASGFSDQERRIPMNPDDIMFSGSAGKTFVAALVLRLCEEGLISLNARAAGYLEHETWFMNVANAPRITVEMLLNHTAGIPEYVYDKEIWLEEKRNPDKVWSVRERLSYTFGMQPSNYPGAGWNYADSHYLILGLILEKVTGKSYYSLLDSLVLKPCRLTFTQPADHRDLQGLIPGYTSLSKEFFLPCKKMVSGGKYAFNPQLEWTGGGLVTNVSDLVLWANQLYGGDFLKKTTLEKMVTPVPFPTTLPENAGYGLGCITGKTCGIKYFGHSGFVPGYLTIVQYLPAYHMAVAMQTNCDALHGSAFQDIFNIMKNTACRLIPDRQDDHFMSPVN